jgi:S1-C subfamily serine protease
MSDARISRLMKMPSHRASSTGIVVSAKVLVGVVAVIALLLALTLVSFSDFSSGTSSVTTTKLVTVTNAANTQTIIVPEGDPNGTIGINSQLIYANTNESIVTLQGTQVVQGGFLTGSQEETVLGSGFVIDYSGSYYIVTNYHVAGATSNLTVTFYDGNSYPAKVIGSDPYSDLAVVLGENVPPSEYHSITLVSSSTLKVGQYVVAIGNPYGLTGSMTEGIISLLGETIQDPTAGNFSIANVIQFSAPINPGNSGGVLLNEDGQVVGMTTATVSGSQGIGFAIPSSTIIEELPSLISTGVYNQHSYLGIGGADMTYQLAQASGTSVTYGVLVESVVPGGPAASAGLRAGSTNVNVEGQEYVIGGDIIVTVNGTRIIDNNALASYLAQYTVPGQVIVLGVIRGGQNATVNVTLGTRPPLT